VAPLVTNTEAEPNRDLIAPVTVETSRKTTEGSMPETLMLYESSSELARVSSEAFVLPTSVLLSLVESFSAVVGNGLSKDEVEFSSPITFFTMLSTLFENECAAA